MLIIKFLDQNEEEPERYSIVNGKVKIFFLK